MKIKLSINNLETEAEVAFSWEDTKDNLCGAAHRLLLANEGKKITGVIQIANSGEKNG